MIRLFRLCTVVILAIVLFSTISAQESPLPAPSDSTTVALALYDQLYTTQEGNLFFSPYSINTAFLMVYGGARGNTAQQMRDVLMITTNDETLHQTFADYNTSIISKNNAPEEEYAPDRLFTVSNGLWLQADFSVNPDYQTLLEEFYGATITPLDFVNAPEESRQVINQAIADQTRERITNLLPEGIIQPTTRLILTNAVYFKANWSEKFIALESAPFTLLDGTMVDVPSITNQDIFSYYADDVITAVAIPYAGRNSQMVILMPEDFANFEANLAENGLVDLLSNPTYTDIHLTMPKFEFESSFSLSETLTTLGMSDAFNPDAADLSGMSDVALYIQEALHKAFIAVDEEGTEAAAATAIIIAETSAMPPAEPIEVRIDKPFLFYIQDTTTGEILFMGRVLNPAE